MSLFPPTPFPMKGVTVVQAQGAFQLIDLLPPWGGPAEAIMPPHARKIGSLPPTGGRLPPWGGPAEAA
jgi:hypothetical protein